MTTSVGIFIDDSGSTSGARAYHERVLRVLEEHAITEATVRVFTWNTACSETDVRSACDNARGSMHGSGGTRPACIPDQLRTGSVYFDKLVLITDGEIARRDTEALARFVSEDAAAGQRWKSTEAHIIPPRGVKPNATVIAPFITGVPFEVYGPTGELVSRCSSSATDITRLIRSIDTPDALEENYHEIASYLAANTMTRDIDPATRAELLEMRKRIVAFDAAAAASSAENEFDRLFTTEAVERLATTFYTGNSIGSLRNVDVLISMCTKSGIYTMEHLATARNIRMFHGVAPSGPVESIPDITEDCVWQDDILMDTTACLLVPIKQSALHVLRDASQQEMETISRNPLFLLANPRLRDRLKGAFMKALSREVLVGLHRHHHGGHSYSNDNSYSPFSPQSDNDDHTAPIMHPYREAMAREVICLGCKDAHVAANRACLARLLFGGTSLTGSYALWMVVVWYLIRQVGWIIPACNQANVDEYGKELLRTAKVPMGLSSTGERPTQRVPVGVAFLYALHSSRMFDGSTGSGGKDVLRDLFGVYPVLSEALALLGFSTESLAAFGARTRQISRASALLHEAKTSAGGLAGVRQRILTQLAHTVVLAGHTFCLDRTRGDLCTNKRRALLNDRHMVAAGGPLDPYNRKFASIVLPWPAASADAVCTDAEVDAAVNAILSSQCVTDDNICDICPKTLRPWTTVDGEPWEIIVTQMYGSVKRALPLHAMVARLVVGRGGKLLDPDNDADVRDVLLQAERTYGPVLPHQIVSATKAILVQFRDTVATRRTPADRAPDMIRADLCRGYSRAARFAMELQHQQEQLSSLA